MDILLLNKLFNNYKLVSLGWSCYPKSLIKKLNDQETHFFDWIGSSTWGIIKLLNNDFKNIFNYENYFIHKPFPIFIEHDKNYICNKEYYLRFNHDKNFYENEKKWTIFKEKYSRRINRFLKLLKSDDNLLFIHLEENTIRFKYPIYKEIKKYYPKNEKNYHIEQSKIEQNRVKEIVKIIKTKYNKHNFKIIYFSHFIKETKYTDNIIFIKTDSYYDKFNFLNWSKKQAIPSLINNYDYINDILNNTH